MEASVRHGPWTNAWKYARFGLRALGQKGWRRTIADAADEIRFDLRHGTETMRPREIAALPLAGGSREDGVQYQAAAPRVVRALLDRLPAAARDGTFVDYGCGKGRALLLAGESGFRHLVGIEFAPGLAAVCRQNLRRSRVLPADVCSTVLETDAALYQPTEGILVAFLYNPFRGGTLSQVVERLRSRAARDPATVWVVYVNPVGLDVFADAGFVVADAVRVRATLEGVTLLWDPAKGCDPKWRSLVAQTGSLPCRRRVAGQGGSDPLALETSTPSGLPTRDTADCQSALPLQPCPPLPIAPPAKAVLAPGHPAG